MSYERNYTTDAGVKVGHWMLTQRHDDYRQRTVWFAMSGYLDKGCCDGGKAPVHEQSYTMTDVDPTSVDMRAMLAYAAKQDNSKE